MKKIVLILLYYSSTNLFSQTPYNVALTNSSPVTTGPHVISANKITTGNPYSVTNNGNVTLKAANEIQLSPSTSAYAFNSSGQYVAIIDPNLLQIGSFHANGFTGVPQYSKFELGVTLPVSIQQQIDNFLTTGSGINPYDPDILKVKCTFISSTNVSYERYGFYYRDYQVTNEATPVPHNIWTEQATNYKFRIRFAPPETGNYTCNVEIYQTNNTLSPYTAQFVLNVQSSTDPGHLKVATSGLKLQFQNGDIFFGVGNSVPHVMPDEKPEYNLVPPIPTIEGFTWPPPDLYTQFRGWITDIADNKGNFTRIRLDEELGFPIESRDKPIFKPETLVTHLPLAQTLNNYNHNQRQMWEFDNVVSLCENRGVYFMLNILEDQFWNSGNPYGNPCFWPLNPYSTLFPSMSNGQAIAAFFTDTQAKAYYKKKLFYINARWGYSTKLAIWEMINETDNLDGNAANSSQHVESIDGDTKNPYEYDLNFRSGVNLWITEMKTYLQSFYPWHPATTGFGSAQLLNTTLNDLIPPAGLDLYTANSYNSNITDWNSSTFYYAQADISERSGITTFFVNNNRRFLFGELGNHPIVDNDCDRDFHNSVWATSMMGGISNGLYYHDFYELNNVNHRANFNALREFAKRVDWTKATYPGTNIDEGQTGCLSNGQKKQVYTFCLTNSTNNSLKDYVVGWSMNGSSVWFNDLQSFADHPYNNVNEYNLAIAATHCPFTANPYDNNTTSCDPAIIIEGLIPSTIYRIEIYDCYSITNPMLDYFFQFSDANGKLSFKRNMTFANTPNANNYYPDYAFIIKKEISVGRLMPGKNPNDTILYNSNSELCINAMKGLDKGEYTFNWYVNKKQIGSDSVLCFQNLTESSTHAELIVEDKSEQKYYKEYTFKNKNSDVIVYPNPANQFFDVKFTDVKVKDFTVTVINDIGQKLIIKSNENKIITNNLPNGFYVVKINFNGQEKTNKLIISR